MTEIERDSVAEYRREILDFKRVAATSERLNRFMRKKLNKLKKHKF